MLEGVWRTECQGRQFRPKWQKVRQDAENCTVMEPCQLYSALNIIRAIKLGG